MAVWLHFFDHLISITHNSSLITQFFTPVWHHHPISITQYFSHYLWAHTCQPMQHFFFPVPKLTEANIKKKLKKIKKKTPELKTNRPNQWKKKKKKKGKKLRLVLFVGPSCVFNYKNAIELWVMQTETSKNVFSVSITHNSKIRELSYQKRQSKRP